MLVYSSAKVHAERLLKNYSLFAQEAFRQIEPSTKLQWNWHHTLMCDELQGVSECAWNGVKRDLVICVPPGSMKSYLGNVEWLPWEWGTNPAESSLNLSNSDSLTVRFSRKTRMLLMSEWYREWFKLVRRQEFKFSEDQNQKINFETEFGGARECVSITGIVTGKRASRQFIDDPHDIKEALGVSASVATRMQAVADIDDQVLPERLKDPDRQPRVLIMQRVHTDDLAGHWIRAGVRHVVLPLEFDPSRKDIHPKDPRTKPGELLHPARRSHEGLDVIKRKLGLRMYNTQHLQKPTNDEGGIFKRDCWVRLPRSQFPRIEDCEATCQSWDVAVKGKQRNDWTVGYVMGWKDGKIYVYHRHKAKIGFNKLLAAINEVSSFYPTVMAKCIEDAANASAAKEQLDLKIPGIVLIPAKDDKVAYAQSWSPIQEARGIVLPDGEEWAEDCIEEHANFPDGSHDDDIDAMGKGVLRLSTHRDPFAGVRSLGSDTFQVASEWDGI